MTQLRQSAPSGSRAALVRTLRGETEAAEARYRTLFEQVGDSIFVLDEDDGVVDANPAATRLLGYSREELIRLKLHDLLMGKRERLHPRIAAFFERQEWHGEAELRHKDGSPVPVEGHAVPLHGLRLYAAVVRDIYERRRLEDGLRRLNDQLLLSVAEGDARLTDAVERLHHAEQRLQGINREVEVAREAERAFIARELHDEIGQVLTGLGLTLAATTHAPPEEARRRIDEAQALVTDLARRIRRRSLELRPAVLDEWGLRTALIWYVARYEGLTGMRVDLEAEPPPTLEHEVALASYRIVQEALTNVARHARTSIAKVAVHARDRALIVEVSDEGRGFDSQAELVVPTSTGLRGMRERTASLGGSLRVESSPGKGARVIAELPLSGPSTSAG